MLALRSVGRFLTVIAVAMLGGCQTIKGGHDMNLALEQSAMHVAERHLEIQRQANHRAERHLEIQQQANHRAEGHLEIQRHVNSAADDIKALDRLALLGSPEGLKWFLAYVSRGGAFLFSNGEPVGPLYDTDQLLEQMTSVGWQEPCFIGTVHSAQHWGRPWFAIWLDRTRRVAVVERVPDRALSGSPVAMLTAIFGQAENEGRSPCGIDDGGRFSKWAPVPVAYDRSSRRTGGFGLARNPDPGGNSVVVGAAMLGIMGTRSLAMGAAIGAGAGALLERANPVPGLTVAGETCIPVDSIGRPTETISDRAVRCWSGELIQANSGVSLFELLIDIFFHAPEPVKVVVRSRPEGARFRFRRGASYRSTLTNTGPVLANRGDLQTLEITYDKLGRSCTDHQIEIGMSSQGYRTFTCDLVRAH